MKAAACLLALCTIPSLALADAPPAYIGPPDCRVANPHPVEHERIVWSGACQDGYAQGDGVLVWYRDDIVTGRYDGTLVHGVEEGSGAVVSADGDRYAGAFRNSMWEGKGAAVYALGGSYEGEFKAGKPDGHGVMTYAGSGRRQEGEFRDGKLIGTPSVQQDDKPYVQRQQQPGIASRIPRPQVYARFPTNKSWDQLTREQQEGFRRSYPALAPGDEPPYPLKGPAKLFAALAAGAGKLEARGDLMLYVLVGADGKATSVSVIGKPDPELMRFAASAVMLEQYKSAICDGKPCAMLYPFNFTFELSL